MRVALVLLTTACAAEEVHRPVPPYVVASTACGTLPDTVPELPAKSGAPIPNGLRVAWVLQCVAPLPAPPGKERPPKASRADGPATDLLTVLRTPSATSRSRICTDEGRSRFYLALITPDERAIAPAIPVDGCGKPLDSVLEALGNLPFHLIGSHA